MRGPAQLQGGGLLGGGWGHCAWWDDGKSKKEGSKSSKVNSAMACSDISGTRRWCRCCLGGATETLRAEACWRSRMRVASAPCWRCAWRLGLGGGRVCTGRPHAEGPLGPGERAACFVSHTEPYVRQLPHTSWLRQCVFDRLFERMLHAPHLARARRRRPRATRRCCKRSSRPARTLGMRWRCAPTQRVSTRRSRPATCACMPF